MYKVIVSIIILLSTTCSFAEDDAKIEEYEKLFKDRKAKIYALAENLEHCKEFKQEFIHPFTGEPTERNVMGIVEEKCVYKEEMPNNGEMNCKYTEEVRKVVAQQYRDIVDAQIIQARMELTESDGEAKMKSTYTLDGKEVDDPLSQAMNDGTCVISGYE